MQARYRTDYAGEFVVVESRWGGGKKNENREWIPNPIENHHISGRAACIGSSFDRSQFNHTILQRHRGGLLGSLKLQTYGVGEIAQEMRLDFVVETNRTKLNEILATNYQQDNIVYTSAHNCVANPGQFYLVPYKPHLLDIATILYLAAFDGHREIFLLGYNDETPVEHPAWQDQVAEVFTAYSGTQFWLIGEKTRMPDVWVNCSNVRIMNYRDFIGYCDV
jgi:hypothetical protein